LPQRAVGAFGIHPKAPPGRENIANRRFKPLPERAGISDIRWHDLRHTHATLPLSRGVHPKYVQQSLGHTSIQLTLDRDSHWIPSMGTNTASGMDEALD
jgi:integrase